MEDIQTKKILETAKSLLTIILRPLTAKVIGLDKNAESAKTKENLQRLCRGIEQYIDKEHTIVYVGFAGHFSSGKSSTINSILSLGNTKNERKTGLNPTDTAISLITDSVNSQSLMLMSRETAIVPIRSIFIDSELLQTLVISDTPGSGDPQVINGMIQDFLPICDHILYFISASNPVDEADLPVLRQLSSKLPFIPITFIVTRTDEFRIDKRRDLSTDNIDKAKQDQFLGQLISRIKSLTKTDSITPQDFLFIDNEYQYGMDQLLLKINKWSVDIGSQELLKNHGYKVDYYNKNLNEIFHYFLSQLEENLHRSSEFLKTARENISRFDKIVQLNSERLKELWHDGETKLKQVLSEEKKDLDYYSYREFPINLRLIEGVSIALKTLDSNIENQARGYLGQIIGEIHNYSRERLREAKKGILDNIVNGDLGELKVGHYFTSRLKVSPENHKIEIDFSRLDEFLRTLSGKISSELITIRGQLKSDITLSKNQILNEELFKQINKIYIDGANILHSNFDQYFETIQMYRSTVLTRSTKEAINSLRIGTQLDDLDVNFEDGYMQEIKNRATDKVYMSTESDHKAFRIFIKESENQLNQLKESVDSISIPAHYKYRTLEKETLNTQELISNYCNEVESSLNSLYLTTLNEYLDEHETRHKKYSDTMLSLRRLRRRILIKWTLVSGLVFLAIAIALLWSDFVNPSNMIGNIAVGLVTTAIGNILGWVIGYFKSDLKKVSVKKRKEFVAEERIAALDKFGETLWDELSRKIETDKSGKTGINLKTIFDGKIKTTIDELLNDAKVSFEMVAKSRIKMQAINNEYKAKLDFLFNKFSTPLLETTKNLTEIAIITEEVKSFAIKPSFDLIENTAAGIVSLKKEIENLSKNNS